MTTNHRVVILGQTAVGKTSIINQYIYNSAPTEHQPTLGIDFFAKNVKVGTRAVRLQLWDTAGQEKFQSLIPSYLRNASIAILVYDITSRETFEQLDKWHQFTLEQASPVFFVVGNKTDLGDARQVSAADGKAWADAHDARFFETSAQAVINIAELFQAIAEVRFVEVKAPGEAEAAAAPKVELASPDAQKAGGGCC
jgi:Ras-related protein Rab-6A